MTPRENILRAARFEGPEFIPMIFLINDACWNYYPQDALQELMCAHPLLFPDYQKQASVTPTFSIDCLADKPYTDPWGCVWETTDDGIVGVVTRHPLGDWAVFEDYHPPTVDSAYDWAQIAQRINAHRVRGEFYRASLGHGHTFLRLCDLRGYENTLIDMIDEDDRFARLLSTVEQYNLDIVQRLLGLGVEWMGYPEDLGMQKGPMISPALFRQYIKPVYARLMHPAREAGVVIHMHSDGDLHDLLDDMLDLGITVLNLQDLVNGLDWIKDRLRGKVCIELDIDRQEITRFGTPAQIEALIRDEVATLGSREGGLMMLYGLYPGVPLENVSALMDALERYAGYYA